MAALWLAGCGAPAPDPAGNLTTPAGADKSLPPSAPAGIWLDEDPYLRGYPALAEAVAALGNNLRVLHTGAHPDDERSDLMAYLARGRHFRTAYLAATRGEGGQNGIGPEKGIALGVLRTEEMLAARRIDGAEQYFLSKADFGFSKTAAETFKNWGHDATLKELVTFLRWYRPQVIISAFSGTPFDGHGHHQAMGLLTREAFDRAADPTYDTGQPPWTTQVLFNSLYNDPGEDKIVGQRFVVDTGVYDPLLGKTYHQMAMAGRSEHRSQDMGQAQDPGPCLIPLRLWALAPGAKPPAGVDPFAGVLLAREARSARTIDRQPSRDNRIDGLCDDVLRQEAAAQAAFAKGDRPAFLSALAAGLNAAHQGGDLPIDAMPWFSFAASARQFSQALYLATGVVFDLRCDKQFLTPGESATLTVRFIGRADAGVGDPAVSFDHAEAWHILVTAHTEPALPQSPSTPLPPPGPEATKVWTWTCTFTVPVDTPYTQPQYLPMAWSDMADYGNHHQATMDLPPIVAHLTCKVAQPAAPAAQLKISTSAQYVWTDPRYGERREMVKIVPPVSVAVTPKMLVRTAATAGQPLNLTAQVTALGARPVDGRIHLLHAISDTGPALGWTYHLSRPGSHATGVIDNIAPRFFEPPASAITLHATAWPAVAGEYQDGLPQWRLHETLTRVDYPHIRPHHLYAPASAHLLQLDVTLPKDLKVAYIAGPGTDDELIDALRQMGATVSLLDEAALEKADFKQFDTVFAGVRAYEVRPDLVAQNTKLLDYVKAGGTLVVLYQKTPFAKLNCAPAPFQYSDPHDRVTEEDAPVTILKPDHQLLTTPNKITEKDFAGWHQDRGLYFFAEDHRDSGYTALLSCHDENEPAKTGGLLDYSLGQGHWVYCAYALHLQIPEAVPGAWRILANLAASGRTEK